MKISFIGAGKAGRSLAKYFTKNEHEIAYVYDIDRDAAYNFTGEVHCKYTSLKELIENSDIIFLTVVDSQIKLLWDSITSFNPSMDKIFIHCSGAMEGIYEKFKLFALHPASPLTGDGDLEEVVFGLEDSNDEKVKTIYALINNMGNKVVRINKGCKSKYHLANVMVSNLVLSLFERGLSHLEECGISQEDAVALLMPLAKKNLLNIESKGIKDAVTGPVQRKDYKTVSKHLETVNHADKDLYIYLSKNIEKILNFNTSGF